ncbi:MAG TPA: sigma-70 family RNA polymerase sigma factor [Thermoanaerobaculia bacterium]|jgi:RNA polymerase sigma factor for flagellar operon FliA|nr:sigma-70 family RNA polymerase sigma factor [Thermoanaerobaculia bacterium]
MEPAALFQANLTLIDRVIAGVCRRARLYDADAEDFASVARLALMEDDHAILRKWEARSSLEGYLTIVIRRLLSDQRNRDLGRWHASADATRLGPAAVLLEQLLTRDGRALEEAVPIVVSAHPELRHADVVSLSEKLPPHTKRPRAVALEGAVLFATERADARVLENETRSLSEQASRVVRRAIDGWPDEDAMILRFRFGSMMSIAEISRMLRLPQRPLYRRIEAMLAALRHALDGAGLDAAVLSSVIGEASQELNFGLADWKNAIPRQSLENDAAAEESR